MFQQLSLIRPVATRLSIVVDRKWNYEKCGIAP